MTTRSGPANSGDVAPDILSGLQLLRAEGIEHIDAGLGRRITCFHLGFVGFQRRRRRTRNGGRKYARSRQRQRKGQLLHFTHLILSIDFCCENAPGPSWVPCRRVLRSAMRFDFVVGRSRAAR